MSRAEQTESEAHPPFPVANAFSHKAPGWEADPMPYFITTSGVASAEADPSDDSALGPERS